MTETEWLVSTNPWNMMKCPVYTVASRLPLLRDAWDSPLCGDERYMVVPGDQVSLWNDCQKVLTNIHHRYRRTAADLMREVLGNPWRIPLFNHDWRTPTVLALANTAYEEQLKRKCPGCIGGVVTGEPYDGNSTQAETWTCMICGGTGHSDNGSLDPTRLAILADALMDAGCDNEVLLGHLRGQWACWGSGMVEKKVTLVHVRGCWALDAVRGKAMVRKSYSG